MKKIFLLIPFLLLETQVAEAQDSLRWTKEAYKVLHEKQLQTANDMRHLRREMNALSVKFQALSKSGEAVKSMVDSLYNDYERLHEAQAFDREMANQRIDEVEDSIAANRKTIVSNQVAVESRSMYAAFMFAALIIIIAISAYVLRRKGKRERTSIREIRKAQDALQNAQTKMQEESIHLDNKLLEIAERQMKTSTTINAQDAATVDHSLALKVADEIVRIELNLSRMDSSIKGYKQLAKAVQRIKDNFQANGYELVDMLGKPYNEGMKVIANFVSDENVEQGKQIITGIIKPQINYNGKMIQSAQITVSQNI